MNANGLLLFTMLGTAEVNSQPNSLPAAEASHETQTAAEDDDIKPDKALLLFLAEWDETQDGQWLDPAVFADDSSFNQQLESPQATNQDDDHHENNSDRP